MTNKATLKALANHNCTPGHKGITGNEEGVAECYFIGPEPACRVFYTLVWSPNGSSRSIRILGREPKACLKGCLKVLIQDSIQWKPLRWTG